MLKKIIFSVALLLITACEKKEEPNLVISVNPKGDAGPFNKPITVELESSIEGATIFYTTDGADPTLASPDRNIYSNPFVLSEDTQLKVYSEVEVSVEGSTPGQKENKTLYYGPALERYQFIRQTLSQEACIEKSRYWYDNTCHETNSTDSAVYTDQESCRQAAYYWYTDKCNLEPITCDLDSGLKNADDETCTSIALAEATTAAACRAIGSYWYGDICNENAISCSNDSGLKQSDNETCTSISYSEAQSSTACSAISKYWYNNTCNDAAITCALSSGLKQASDVSCETISISEATTEAACHAIDYYWYSSTCNTSPGLTCTNTSQTLSKGATITNSTCSPQDSNPPVSLSYSLSDCGTLSVSSSGVVSGTMPAYSCTPVITVTDGTNSSKAALDFTVSYADINFKAAPYGFSGFNTLLPEGNDIAATDDSGTLTVWRATDAGLQKSTDSLSTWTTYTTVDGLPMNDVESVWAEGSNVFVGTFYGNAWSTNGGSTWSSNSTIGEDMAGVCDGSNLTVYAACNNSCAVSRYSSGSWSSLGSDPGQNETVHAFDPDCSDNSTSDHIIIIGLSSGVVVSSDGGSTFTAVKGTSWSYAVAAVEISSSIYYLQGRYGAIYLSTDAGDNWTEELTGSGTPHLRVVGTTVYASFSGSTTLYSSTDGGQNWSSTSSAGGDMVAFSGTNWIKEDNDTIYLSTNSGTSYGSGVSIASTTPSHVGWDNIYGSGNTVFAGNFSTGLYKSTDNGETWARKTTSNGLANNRIDSIYADGEDVYVSHSSYGISYSSDGGDSFSSFRQSGGLPDDDTKDVFGIGNSIYVGTSAAGLAISNNSGSSWTNVDSSTSGFAADAVNAVWGVGSNYIFAGTNSGLCISSDGGSTWSTITTSNGLGGSSDAIIDVQAYERYDSSIVVYALTSSGISKSTNGGTSFSLITSEGSGAYGFFIKGKTIVMGANQKTWISYDEGSTWDKGGGSFNYWTNSIALSNGFPGYASRDSMWFNDSYIFSSSGSGLARSTP